MITARIGMVNYINTAPIYEVWKQRVNCPDWQVTEAPPTTLNRLISEDRLDLGFVSSYEYARAPQRYRILADLSISSTGPVGSVFLFSRVAPEALTGKTVLLTGQSDTSVCLVKIILETFIGAAPLYTRGEVFTELDYGEEISAVLAIGDEALRLKNDDRYPLALDLGEMWHRETGLPFVFAVCAVREEYLAQRTDVVREIHNTLLSCKEDGLASLAEICSRVAKRIPMDPVACSRYLHAMEYDLGLEKQKALETFFTYLMRRGEADQAVLPLKIFS